MEKYSALLLSNYIFALFNNDDWVSGGFIIMVRTRHESGAATTQISSSTSSSSSSSHTSVPWKPALTQDSNLRMVCGCLTKVIGSIVEPVRPAPNDPTPSIFSRSFLLSSLLSFSLSLLPVCALLCVPLSRLHGRMMRFSRCCCCCWSWRKRTRFCALPETRGHSSEVVREGGRKGGRQREEERQKECVIVNLVRRKKAFINTIFISLKVSNIIGRHR